MRTLINATVSNVVRGFRGRNVVVGVDGLRVRDPRCTRLFAAKTLLKRYRQGMPSHAHPALRGEPEQPEQTRSARLPLASCWHPGHSTRLSTSAVVA